MIEKGRTDCPRLWISYPWIDREEKDFGYLAGQLESNNFEAVYDSVRIMRDDCFSRRIVQRLQSIGFDGWLYVLTHQCITRREYTAELTSAVDQTLLHLGPRFPIVGLMHGIAPNHVPPRLRILPCVSLGDPGWNLQVGEIFRRNQSIPSETGTRKESRFVWKIHPGYGGNPSIQAVEVHSRGETIESWRFAIPRSCHPVRWGQGNSGGGELSKLRFGEAAGTGRYENNEIFWFGASNTVSLTESAYVLFEGSLPDFICFGLASKPAGTPGKMEIFWPHRKSSP
ncbi:MAG: hypothetical protein JW793_00875 [Acidobacteria bacterium]|nr:hypothetical protein [Acidobacteriota bacterium]